MQASTVSAIASSTSAVIGAIAASISAFSAWNSRKSAQASVVALQETRRQREIDNARVEFNALGRVYDDAMVLADALVREAREPTAVQQARERLRRSMMAIGVPTPVLSKLVEATVPLTSDETEALRGELTARSAELQRISAEARLPPAEMQRRSAVEAG